MHWGRVGDGVEKKYFRILNTYLELLRAQRQRVGWWQIIETCTKQFEIVGADTEIKGKLGRFYVKGNRKYARIVIRHSNGA